MTQNQFVQVVNAYQFRNRVAVDIEDLESKIITYITFHELEGKQIQAGKLSGTGKN